MRNIFKYLAAADLSTATAVSYEYFEMHEEETAAQSSRHYAKRIPKSKPLVNYEDSIDSDLDTTEVAENVGTGTPTVVFNMNKKNGPAANQGTESDSDSSVTVS